MAAVHSQYIFYCKQDRENPFNNMNLNKIFFPKACHTFQENRKNTDYNKPKQDQVEKSARTGIRFKYNTVNFASEFVVLSLLHIYKLLNNSGIR